ncbi:MAG: acyl carrier protein [Coriobacteriia bacterium]|nr:acyl carrier protein [Coriobacteriia bacterium]MCL2750926.1 acyl carrier protein [Coriobacteriia bacterium]
MAESTLDIVTRALVDGLSVDEEAVKLEAHINNDLGADSLDAVELIMSLEEEFGIEIEPARAKEIQTVKDLVDLVDSLKS